VAALDAYEQTLRSVCLSGRYRTRVEVAIPIGGNYAEANQQSWVAFECDPANGRHRYDHRRSWIYPRFSPEFFENRKVQSFDGERSFQLLYTFAKEPTGTGFPPERPYLLNTQRTEIEWLALEPRHLAGLRMRWENRSLVGVLQGHPSTWEGATELAGVRCYRISLHPPGSDTEMAVWLDPAHGFLPVRQEWVKYASTAKRRQHVRERIDTTQFEEFPLPGGKPIWFPVKARIETQFGSVETLEIEELAFHSSLPAERFRIAPDDLPPGVHASSLDRTDSSYTGGDEGRSLHEEWQRLFDVQTQTLREKLGPPATGAPSVPPPNSQQKSDGNATDIWFLTNAVVLSLAGAWIAFQCYRSFRRSTLRRRGTFAK
jgi:hypothetical protein